MNNQIEVLEVVGELKTNANQKFSFIEMILQNYFFFLFIPMIILIFEFFKNDITISLLSIVVTIVYKKEIDKSLVFQKYKYFIILFLIIITIVSKLVNSNYGILCILMLTFTIMPKIKKYK
ncbi:MAG: hypothetical protein NTW25_02075 [Candidatus Kapabacteria bacterium]|nr:hypothetical protein [Candidatus Kapabacteria bacterium]